MPHKPLISKIRCHNPNKGRTSIANRNCAVYIGTREGVDLSYTPEEENKNYYESSDTTYLDYIGNRPGSHGLFGNIKTNDLQEVAAHIEDISGKKIPIFRGIVSLCEEDALALGYDRKENWVSYMNRVMPEIADEFHIPVQALEWVGAVHMESGHPHVHYMFWRNDGKVMSPFIHTSRQNRVRQKLSGIMFEEEREQALIQKNLQRTLLTDHAKKMVKEELMVLEVPDLALNQKIPGHLSIKDANTLALQLLSLKNSLPEKGRITYRLMPPDVKEKTDGIVKSILARRDMSMEMADYLSAVDAISSTYSPSPERFTWSHDNALQDIEKRLGNIVLQSAKDLRKKETELLRLLKKESRLQKQEEWKARQERQLALHASCRMFRIMFRAMCTESGRRQAQYSEISMMSKSKQALKDAAKKNEVGAQPAEE